MTVQNLYLKNVRNFTEFQMSFDPSLNIIFGQPNSGKTTVLDYIWKLSLNRGLELVQADFRDPMQELTAALTMFDGFIPNDYAFTRNVSIQYSGYTKEVMSVNRTPTLYIQSHMKTSVLASREIQTPEYYLDDALTLPSIFANYDISTRAHLNAALLSLADVYFMADEAGGLRNRDTKADVYIPTASGSTKRALTLLFGIATLLASRPMDKPVFERPGLVLIDNIETGFHPSKHHMLMEVLMRAFPNTQFVVTTNSPLIVASMPTQHVWQMSDTDASHPFESYGLDASHMLTYHMGTTDRIGSLAEALQKISDLIDAKQYTDAKAKIRAVRHVHGEFPDLARLQAHVDVSEIMIRARALRVEAEEAAEALRDEV